MIIITIIIYIVIMIIIMIRICKGIAKLSLRLCSTASFTLTHDLAGAQNSYKGHHVMMMIIVIMVTIFILMVTMMVTIMVMMMLIILMMMAIGKILQVLPGCVSVYEVLILMIIGKQSSFTSARSAVQFLCKF